MVDTRPVPLFVTRPALEPLLDEVAERQRAVLDSGRYILGPEVEAFEAEFARYSGRRFCIGVANGTDAIVIALRALGVRPGGEVIVPGVSFFATAEAVALIGARPVFADLDPELRCISAETVEPLIGPRTEAIVPVHLFGSPAPMEDLIALGRSRGVPVMADAAQAAGARIRGEAAGAFGDAATFSFYPGKNLGAFGDAGAIVTDDPKVDEIARRLRAHGEGGTRWKHVDVGLNSRLDELQAAALRVVLPHLDDWTAARRRAARAYEDAGIAEQAEIQRETPGAQSAYHLYVIAVDDRDRLSALLAESGIETRAYYTTPLHRQPALQNRETPAALPASEELAARNLAIPMGPALDEPTARSIVGAIERATAA